MVYGGGGTEGTDAASTQKGIVSGKVDTVQGFQLKAAQKPCPFQHDMKQRCCYRNTV